MAPRASAAKAKSQLSEFKKTARALECDESPTAFDDALGKIGRVKAANVKKQKATKSS